MDEEAVYDVNWTLFDEPADFRPPSPKPSTTEFTTAISKRVIMLNLPPKHSLWAHWLWNAAKFMADFLERNRARLVRGKRVLELGAAAALPSIICCLEGASLVIATDYPDLHLMNNIHQNAIQNNLGPKLQVKGYIWGQNLSFMDEPLLDPSDASTKFDLVLMADLIFNHNQHHALYKSLIDLLSPNGICLVTFSHHNPKWIDRDLAFFNIADDNGFKTLYLGEKMYEPMFQDDVGCEVVRSTVYCYALSWKDATSIDLGQYVLAI